MNFNKDVNKETSKAKDESQKNSINETQHGAVPIDPPPSYNEAMQIHPYQDISYSSPPATALSLETNNAISYPYNNFTPGSFLQSGTSNDKKFQQWDNNATRIVIIKRLQMNDQFEAAKHQREIDLLWNIIMNDLLIHGYHFTIFDLMMYWGYLFQLYTEILNGIVSGSVHHTDWEYFPFMHQTFGSNDGSRLLDQTVLPVSTVIPDTAIIPAAVTLHLEPQKIVDNLDAPLTLPNSNALPTPNVSIISDDLPSSEIVLNPPSASTSAYHLSSDDRTPLLLKNNIDPVLQSEILTNSSNLVESSSDPIPTSATTLLPASSMIPSTSTVPAVMTIPPSEPIKVSNPTIEPISILPNLEAVTTAPSIPLTNDLSSAVPLLNPQDSTLINTSSEQVPLLLQVNNNPDLSSRVWLKLNAMIDEKFMDDELTKPVLQLTTADDAAAGIGEIITISGPIQNLMQCIPPVEFSTNPAVGLTAVTTQPGDGISMTKILEDSNTITSQPTASMSIPMVDHSYGDDYECYDSCCGEDFCCGDCYCEGGDCDLGDCGGL